ncbi:MAG: digeranylgeranylglycerophospholipid reductase [Gemmatimonadetes bacterium]|nr:digeranylgeranylglycerophospholipid reductase [Gemmatimonadota bacterium]
MGCQMTSYSCADPKGGFDVVVVGAGPAGSMAAKHAAANGAEVLLLDRKRDPGTPVRCGEGVSAAGLAQYVDPQPEWISAGIKGARLVSPSGVAVEIGTLGAGYVLERKLFDRGLIELAAKAGARVLSEANAVGLRRGSDGRIAGVRVVRRGSESVVPCKIVIGADGVDSRVGRWAGIRTDLRLADMESCAQYLIADCETEKGFCEFFLGRDVSPGGYAWIFPKGDGLANVGLGVSVKEARRRGSAIEHLDRFMERLGLSGKMLGFTVGGVPVSHTLDTIVADSVMLAGDAARQVNPMTGGGILTGMLGGQLAGETAAEAIREGEVSARVLGRYSERWHERAGKTNKRWYRIKEAVGRLPDSTLDETARVFEGTDAADLTLFKIFARIFRRNPKLIWDIRHVFMG